MEPEAKVAEVEAFIRSGGSVCSFAPGAAALGQIEYHIVPFEHGACDEVRRILHEFFKQKRRDVHSPEFTGACVFVDSADLEGTFEERALEQYNRIHQMQEEILIAMRQLMFPESWCRTETVRKRVKEFLRTERGVIGPRVKGVEPIIFGMGPCYDEKHRRYAPHVVIPITIREDANHFAEQYPAMRDETHEEIIRRMGEPFRLLRFYEPLDPYAEKKKNS